MEGINHPQDGPPHGIVELVPQIPEHLRLRDLQHYVETRGLRNEPVGDESVLNVAEKKRRLEEAAAHQERILQKVFGQEVDDDSDNRNNKNNRGSKDKASVIESLDEEMIIIKTLDGPVEVHVKPLVTHCDAVYALASTLDKYNSEHLELSLETYSEDSIREFVDLVSGLKPVHQVSPENVVMCCQIAHYLQCRIVLDPLVDILVDAVDTENCSSLLELADRLNFPILFERSLSHMMESLSEAEGVWDDLSPELRDRVTLMKKAVQSSILTGTSRLYFTSLDEYIALFAENVEYHRERLFDAKERLAETRESHLIRSRAWEYNKEKVEIQERRVHRLEILMKEQKKIFSTKVDRSTAPPVRLRKTIY